MLNIPTDATVSYNGITFSGAIDTKLTMTAIRNKVGNTIKAWKYSLQIDAVIAPDGGQTSTDTALDTLRSKLSEPQRTLVFLEKGAGSITIRPLQEDINYGPFPTELGWETIAGNRSARIVWKVEWEASECTLQNISALGQVTELWWTHDMSTDERGLRTITKTGYMEVAGGASGTTKNVSSKLPEIFKDKVLPWLKATKPDRFKIKQDYSFTQNLLGVDFKLTYTEYSPNNDFILPTGASDLNIDHSMNSELLSTSSYNKGFLSWLNTLTVEVELLSGVSLTRGFAICQQVGTSIIGRSITTITQINNDGVRTAIPKIPLILSLDFNTKPKEGIVSMQVAWMIYGNTFKQALERSGLFSVIDVGNSSQQWAERNSFELFKITDKTVKYFPSPQPRNLFDVCSTIQWPTEQRTEPKEKKQDYVAVWESPCPSPEQSWINYDIEFEYRSKGGIRVHKKFKSATERSVSDGSRYYKGVENKVHIDVVTHNSQVDSSSESKDYYYQDMGNDRFYVILKGTATRVGYAIPQPELADFGGKPVVFRPDMSSFSQRQLKSAKCPMFKAKWKLVYEVVGSPKGDFETKRTSNAETTAH